MGQTLTEPANLNRAARVIASVAPGLPGDLALRHYFANGRPLPAADRRAVTKAVFATFRWRQWLDAGAAPQAQVAHALQLQDRFQRDPGSIKPEALAARAVPDWLASEMTLTTEFLRQLQSEPPLWLRARPGQAKALADDLGGCQPTPASLDALRYTGHLDLYLTPQFHSGAFEIQDLASQLVGIAAGPQPGQTWWDACAGEGGKTLHLADLMNNKGLVWASDRSVRRLEVLKRRTARAKLFNYRAAPWDGSARLPTKARFDGILVDAPCTGVGTWRRNPHARWTVTPDDVKELAAVQIALLLNAASGVKPGGRLVYAVCTLTRSETEAVADAFSAARPEFEPAPFSLPTFEAASRLTIPPDKVDANGMFIASWRRKAQV